jgi:hypothetical protein
MSNHMGKNRFYQIRMRVSDMAANVNLQESDPWWRVRELIEDFNENRKNTLAAGIYKTADETMSGYRPRTTKNGNLPHISHIMRKPVDLGTEFKNTADAETDIMMFLEIQKGRDPMRAMPYSMAYGATAACTIRMAEGVQKNGQKEASEDGSERPADIILADSWFASVNTAEQLEIRFKSRFVGVVKSAHTRFPKDFIESSMKTWPAGTHLVLHGTTGEGVKLLAIGYKYNKKKVLSFVATANAGHTEPGEPYRARWIGPGGERMSKNVQHPDIADRYFKY